MPTQKKKTQSAKMAIPHALPGPTFYFTLVFNDDFLYHF